jgi:S1-C subfamily serine protease
MFCTNCGSKLEPGNKFCVGCGQENKLGWFYAQKSKIIEWLKNHKKNILILSGIIILLIIISASSSSSTNNSNTQSTSQAVQNESQSNIATTPNQDKIASSVVNIMCSDGTDDGSAGGSGTIMDTDGLILTNAHIIPHSSSGNISQVACVVTLPDAQGKVKEIYYGQPILIPKLSLEYDLAFIEINDSYTDNDGVTWGTYPNVFPSFLDTVCENDNPSLGESVRVFGYPAISGGGYYLTITDGVVSSLPNDGTIVTSAKISHGNSGGIAVDENGCFIGIPAMFDSDEAGSLGILISNNTIVEFMAKIKALQDSK